MLYKLVVPGLVPGIHVCRATRKKDVDGRAFAAPKGLRPRRRVKPGHDDTEAWVRQAYSAGSSASSYSFLNRSMSSAAGTIPATLPTP